MRRARVNEWWKTCQLQRHRVFLSHARPFALVFHQIAIVVPIFFFIYIYIYTFIYLLYSGVCQVVAARGVNLLHHSSRNVRDQTNPGCSVCAGVCACCCPWCLYVCTPLCDSGVVCGRPSVSYDVGMPCLDLPPTVEHSLSVCACVRIGVVYGVASLNKWWAMTTNESEIPRDNSPRKTVVGWTPRALAWSTYWLNVSRANEFGSINHNRKVLCIWFIWCICRLNASWIELFVYL